MGHEYLKNTTNSSSVNCFQAAPEGAPINTCASPYWEDGWDPLNQTTCKLSPGACSSIELFSPNKATCIDLGCTWEDAYCTGGDTNASGRINSWLLLMVVGT